MDYDLWLIERGDLPLVATALHDGHALRAEVAHLLALDEPTRLREEDPFTGPWTAVAPNRIVPRRSRFEVDLNRVRENAVYLRPDDAWGLQVWTTEPPARLVERSLADYDAFYRLLRELLSDLASRYSHFVVLDLHSYNHRRDGHAADPAAHPEINVGTGSLDPDRWAGVVARFMGDLRAHDFLGRRLDVRENVRFPGGHLSRWVHREFPRSGCVLAVEVKKFFMDEWSGVPDARTAAAITDALASTVPGILEELARL